MPILTASTLGILGKSWHANKDMVTNNARIYVDTLPEDETYGWQQGTGCHGGLRRGCKRHASRGQFEPLSIMQMNQLGGPISYTQAQKIPYLRAVVAEATRLLPSIIYQLLRDTPEDGLTVNGHFLPYGTAVGISRLAQN
ncbi:hypothetical protein EDB81DRAFT_905699 [Dactylonectria macrodidyma]|uniref:Uncharacterized protein n=1 Tax=Dactylonectria macrodidyma TaxID=307937 RepID=A0A9P9E594_9HYPO|nr:hypothetical protein EDB81DRAFT_905699 [Dactylonectria macrodidyma]